MEGFSERLELFLKTNYKNYADFAKTVGLDRSQITAYVKGRTKPLLKKMEEFYEAGVDPNWLITGKGNMFSDSEKGLKLHEAYIEKQLISNQEQVYV